jgi:hypothetical protein
MDKMIANNCPHCGEPLPQAARNERRCPRCGQTLPTEEAGQPAWDLPAPPDSEHIAEPDLLAKNRESALPPSQAWPEPNIRRSEHGETLAVLALLLPLVAQGLILACHFDSVGIETALSWGTVAVTALMLAVDAAFLGSTDLRGTQRAHPGGLFLGMILLWIVVYPMVYFRRRHFGRPNLGPLALLVAVFFVAVPFVHNFGQFGLVVAGVPTCTSKAVTNMVDDLIRQSALGPSVQSITDHRETSYDSSKQLRKGQCLVKTPTEIITATFSVKMVDAKAGTFQVELDPIVTTDPPLCTDLDVIELLERLVREGPNGRRIVKVTGHEEIRYDKEQQIRQCSCKLALQGRLDNVVYKVYWLDQKTGQFQVQIVR